MTEDEMVKKLPPISDELRLAIDRETQAAYGAGADAVWKMLGVGRGEEFPNDAVYDEATKLYVIRPKSAGPPDAPKGEPLPSSPT